MRVFGGILPAAFLYVQPALFPQLDTLPSEANWTIGTQERLDNDQDNNITGFSGLYMVALALLFQTPLSFHHNHVQI